MPDLFLDKQIPDYYVEHNWRDIAGNESARDAVIENFLSEKLCILYGYDLRGLDIDFLRRITLPQTWEMKKLQFQNLLREADESQRSSGGLLDSLRQTVFNGNEAQLCRFIEQLRQLKKIADDLTSRLLAGRNVDAKLYVSRFSETRMENLHYDIDKDSDNHDSFRLYINLDSAPRLWATSYQLTHLVEAGGQRLVDGLDDSKLPSETLLKRVTTSAFGGWNQRATERTAPRHLAFFDPGDIWLVDGRCVSHQVLTGHRVLSIYARLPHATNSSLKPTFNEKIRSAFKKAREVPRGSETAQIAYYMPDQVTSAANLKEDWSSVFGQTGTGRARRFDDFGLARPA